MSFQDFINKWDGKGIDFDGAYGDQCMDLMHQYVVEVLGLSDGRILAAPAAKDVYLTFPGIFGSQYFEQIANTPTGVPSKGDIVLWGTGIGPYGHVAIFVEGDSKKFKSFDQNFPTGSNCHVQDHGYAGVLGWLHPKTAPQSTPTDLQAELDKVRADRDKNWSLFKAQEELVQKLNQQINDRNNDITRLQADASNLKDQLLGVTQERDRAQEIAKRVPQLEKQLAQAMTDRDAANQDRAKAQQEATRLRATSYTGASDKLLFQQLVKRIANKFGK